MKTTPVDEFVKNGNKENAQRMIDNKIRELNALIVDYKKNDTNGKFSFDWESSQPVSIDWDFKP